MLNGLFLILSIKPLYPKLLVTSVFFCCLFFFGRAAGAPIKITRQQEALKYWHYLDFNANGVHGISLTQAYKVLVHKKSHNVVVALLDRGVDTDHQDFKTAVWVNPGEIAKDGKDNDGNGFVDDINGWNFLTNKTGQNISANTLELTRILQQLGRTYVRGRQVPEGKATHMHTYNRLLGRLERLRAETKSQSNCLVAILQKVEALNRLLKNTLRLRKISCQHLSEAYLSKTSIGTNKELLLSLVRLRQLLEQQHYRDLDELAQGVKRLLEAHDKRLKIGLNMDVKNSRQATYDILRPGMNVYGNNEIINKRKQEGTNVAGVIVNRNDKVGQNQSAQYFSRLTKGIKLLVIRILPDYGDPYDEDIANGIYYAVSCGAAIINMNFSKEYAKDSKILQAAVKYAEKNNVLIVHGTSANSTKLDPRRPTYPNKYYGHGAQCSTWIEVGGSTWKDTEHIVAPFTDYGREYVDVLAPALDIYSTGLKNGYTYSSGNNMGAAIVTSMAAILKSYYPKFTAKQLTDIIQKSCVRMPRAQKTISPQKPACGGQRQVPKSIKFEEMCRYGIVNLYNAVKAAETESSGSWIKRIFSRK